MSKKNSHGSFWGNLGGGLSVDSRGGGRDQNVLASKSHAIESLCKIIKKLLG